MTAVEPRPEAATVPEDSPVTVLRCYPTAVVLPTGPVYGRALVHVTRSRIYVWTSVSPSGDPLDPRALAYVADLVDGQDIPSRLPASVRDTVNVLVGPGEAVVISRARGCTCNALARWKPFSPDLTGGIR